MARRTSPATHPAPDLPSEVVAEIREGLARVSDAVVRAVIAEVPSYTDAFSGRMGEQIRNAVRVALGGFLSLAGADPAAPEPARLTPAPTAPAVEGAYQLGRGEARSGRTTEAILSAYRIGARVAWEEMAADAVRAGLDADALAAFAGLVFAYIDELSAASVAGHTDEAETTGRARRRHLEQLAGHLLAGAAEPVVRAVAARADWPIPETLTAIVVPESQVRPLLVGLGERAAHTLRVTEAADLDEMTLLLVPDAHDRRRPRLLRAVGARGATAGPGRPWLEVSTSVDRAVRARALSRPEGASAPVDTEQHLVDLVLGADPEALADLRADVLAPLASLRPATIEKLSDTLRAWLLHLGRREAAAGSLFVHPQTVRYRMSQLRDAYGDRLDDPDQVLAILVALGPRRR